MPIIITNTKLVAASLKTKVPVNTAAKANRKTTKLEASLSKLSPSTMVTKRLGTLMFYKMALAETASGGDTMPPNKKPVAKVKPGIRAADTNATAHDVMITTGNAKLDITRRHFQKSFHDVFQAASYSRGGKNITKIRSG